MNRILVTQYASGVAQRSGTRTTQAVGSKGYLPSERPSTQCQELQHQKTGIVPQNTEHIEFDNKQR